MTGARYQCRRAGCAEVCRRCWHSQPHIATPSAPGSRRGCHEEDAHCKRIEARVVCDPVRRDDPFTGDMRPKQPSLWEGRP